MTYTIQRAIDFWYEFDQLFEPRILGMDPNVSKYYGILFPNFTFDRLLLMWYLSRKNNNYPQDFINNFDQPMRDATRNLMNLQFEKIDKYFSDKGAQTTRAEMLHKAFEDFAQGILFDTRRVNGKRIHKMDGDPPEILIGYYRWHVFIRAMSFIDQTDTDKLLELDQNVSLAWAIEDEMNPVHDDDNTEPNPGINPRNPEMDPARLRKLESFWLAKNFDGLDNAFDNEELQTYIRIVYGINL
jgi:hypothetical protein